MAGQQRDETTASEDTREASADNVCEYPGCAREKRAAGPGAGRPPAFCDLADAGGKFVHTAKTAFRKRRELERVGDPVSEAEEAAPATFARESAAEIRDRVAALLATAMTEARRLLERLETAGDPAAYEIEAEHAAAQWDAERGQLHARAAEEAKARRAAERKTAEADAAAEEFDADRQAAEDRAASLARQLAAAIEAHGQELERVRADMAERETAIREDADHEIGIAEGKAQVAEEAQRQAARQVEEAEARASAAGEEADRRVAEITGQADESVREAQRQAARQVEEAQHAAQAAEHRAELAERRAAEADQRTEADRADHAAEIGRLNDAQARERAITDERARDLVQARDDARQQRERAEATVDQLRAELAEARKPRKRRGDDAAAVEA
jgi:hypothetical protein